MIPAIDVEHVCFSYPSFSLDDVSMQLFPGELKALVGLNGSGKTTLMKLILGLLEPGKGEIRVFGRILRRESLWAIRQDLGFLFQNPNDQLFAPTVWEDVAFGPRNQGLSEEEIHDRVRWSLNTMDIPLPEEKPVNQLSYGQAKRVALAGILAMRPKVLLLDEPFTGLDFPTVVGLVDILQALRKERISVFYTTHDRFFVENWAESVMVLRSGRVVFDGRPDEAMNREDLRQEIGNWEQLKRRIE